MAGRALLVCALCVLCCAAGGGWAWDHLCDEDGKELLNVTGGQGWKFCSGEALRKIMKMGLPQNERSSPSPTDAEVGVGAHGGKAGHSDGAASGPGGSGHTDPEEEGRQGATGGSREHSAPETRGPSGDQGGAGGPAAPAPGTPPHEGNLGSVDASGPKPGAGEDGQLNNVTGSEEVTLQPEPQERAQPQVTEGTQTTQEGAASSAVSKNGLSQFQAQEPRGERGASTQLSSGEATILPDATKNTADGGEGKTTQLSPPASREGAAGGQGGNPTEQETKDTTDSDAAWNPDSQHEVAAAIAAAGTAKELAATESTATEARDTATTTGGASGSSPAAQPQPESSVATTEAGQPEQKEQPAVPASQEETETSGERREATQPAAGATAQAAKTTNSTNAAKAVPGDSDGSSTAASHSASPLALLFLLVCAAAAAMVAA
ncbi:mucin-associated surface protein (MASP) [Trypanosoma conorhini]|uniref:Mucin-associated surface protein (MASP) n=1 Tax=Trypanosoma conorhini TaxID=83891 RepID=A0A422MPY7_9TRYP|nr:mucin-associated surface protein (MASP) [Trypanosoma conorhini]RNE95271.1 mucin-associated surface protein (MASP) [Trypanosoma conorhini]